MVQEYIISKKELMNTSIIIDDGHNTLGAIFAHLPARVVSHSYRVQNICSILAGHVPKNLLPERLNDKNYAAALSRGAHYHEIGIYSARNDVYNRPAAGSILIKKYLQIEKTCAMSRVVFETVKYHKQKYIFNDEVPLHAAICNIACAFDMMTMQNGKYSEKRFKKAFEYICNNSGKIFHPKAVKCFELARDEVFGYYGGYDGGRDNISGGRVMLEVW